MSFRELSAPRRAVAVTVIAGCLAVPSVASASTPTPAVPTGVHVAAVSSTAFTVAAQPAANAQQYRLYASLDKSDIYVANLGVPRKTRTTATAAGPRVTVAGLRYAPAVYYYRFRAINGTKVRDTPIASVSLRPSDPTSVRIAANHAGLYLTWSSGAATGFTIAQGTDPALHQNRRDYRIRGKNNQFTPYGLTKGRKYYFRIRADNDSTSSHYSATEVSATMPTRSQPLRVMTYNILQRVSDGTRATPGGQPIAPWNTKRKAAAATLIKRGRPDVIGVQEGGSWVGAVKGARQVDSLKAAIGSGYTLAHTETPPSQPHYYRTGDYIIYRNGAYRAVGAGGHWYLGDARYAAYQVLQSRSSHAKVLVVSTHAGVGNGLANDKAREAQTKRMLAQAQAYARKAGGLPVVYLGDFNSYLGTLHPYDGPGIAMRAAHVADGLLVAQSLSNAQYNSSNQYLRTPPATRSSIDHVFAAPGVAISSWRMLMNLSHGRLTGVIPSDHNPVVASLSYPY